MQIRIFSTIAIGLSLACSLQAKEEDWKPMLNEKLDGWEVWIAAPHSSVKDLPADIPVDAEGKRQPLGLNNDPKGVYTVKMEDGEPVLHITGEIWGGLTTKEEYSRYHFRTQFRWGEKKWEPRLDQARDNGIIYHATGKHGAAWGTWKKCLEFQVQENDMGDFFQIAGTRVDIKAVKEGDLFYYDPAGTTMRFGEGPGVASFRAAHLRGKFEKPHGEWNTLELYVMGRDAVHVVNGNVVLVLHNASAVDKATKEETPLTSGQIQIQSESAECYYRRMEILQIDEFPAEIKKAAEQ